MIAGGGADQFWHHTPREIHAVLVANNDRRRSEFKMQTQSAYLTAYLGRVKDFPALEDVLPGARRDAPPQSDDMMAHNLALWAAVLNPGNAKPN